MKFAALDGVNYPSFANWVQPGKRHRSMSAAAAGPGCGADKVTGKAGSSLRWWEGVVDNGAARFDAAGTARPSGLQLHLPGGVRMGKRLAMSPGGNLLALKDRNDRLRPPRCRQVLPVPVPWQTPFSERIRSAAREISPILTVPQTTPTAPSHPRRAERPGTWFSGIPAS